MVWKVGKGIGVMILRKPYAFFIKYFRVINLIMAILMAILIYQTTVIGRFLNKYISDYTTANNFVLSNYINFYSFLLCLVVIILIIFVTSVMFVKKKPMKLYIFNFVVAIALFIVYIVDYNVMKNIGDAVLDIRLSKAIRDVTFIALGVQAVSFIITLVRATGFDLKSFDFARDLKDLEIEAKDDEEFEVAVELDKNKVRRGFRNKIRHAKYFYFEHRFIVNVIALVVLVIISFMVVITLTMYSSNYNEGQTFTASNLQFNIRNSYITDTDQDGEVLPSDLVVIRFDVRKLTSTKTILNTGLVTLKIGNHYYGQTTKYNGYLTDLGTGYVNQGLDDDYVSYILVFEISDKDVNKSMKLKINDNVSYIRGEVGAKNNFVKLNPIDLEEKKDTVSYNLGDTVSFSGSLLGESTLKINKFEIANKFKNEYDFCYAKNKCFKSYEYVTPTATGNYFKTLMKIDGEFELDENMNLENIDDLYDFLNQYGSIYYKTEDGDFENHKINSQKVKFKVSNNRNSIYIEINREIEKSQKVYFMFNVRNYIYKYNLR